MGAPLQSQVARSTPFDNSTNGFTAINVQDAIEEAKNSAIANDRFIVSCGFDGNATDGRYLEFQSNVDSNLVGWIVPVNCYIKELTLGIVSSSTLTVQLLKKDGTNLTSITLTSARTGIVTGLNVELLQGLEVMALVTSGTGARPILFVNCQKG